MTHNNSATLAGPWPVDSVMLFDLETDPTESDNVAAAHQVLTLTLALTLTRALTLALTLTLTLTLAPTPAPTLTLTRTSSDA